MIDYGHRITCKSMLGSKLAITLAATSSALALLLVIAMVVIVRKNLLKRRGVNYFDICQGSHREDVQEALRKLRHKWLWRIFSGLQLARKEA